MNCTDVATIMDERAELRLTSAERCALDEHLAQCEPCALAWYAHTALVALRIPTVRRSLLDDVIRAAKARALPARRRAGARIVLAAAFLSAGAALAAISFVALRAPGGGDSSAAPRDSGASASSRLLDLLRGAGASRTTTTATRSSGDASTAPAPLELGDFVPIIRTPPDYPATALERRLDGDVQVQFDVAATGAVLNPVAVKSSDPVFESAAIAAISQWRYLPRVVDGKRVAAQGVATIIRFTLTDPPGFVAPKPTPAPPRIAEARALAAAGFERGIEIAWERIAADDLRGAELEIDELRATYDLEYFQEILASKFYGYIFTQYRDYGRAIAAYEAGFAVAERQGGFAATQAGWRELANLYFARNQYDMALKTALRFRRATQALGRESPDVAAYVEKLRALGVTDETL
jgi:TonB family protein